MFSLLNVSTSIITVLIRILHESHQAELSLVPCEVYCSC
jgi:hypothetical protein